MTAEEHTDHWEADVQEEPTSPMRITHASVVARLESADASDPYFGRTVDVSSEAMRTLTIKAHQWEAGWSNLPYRQYTNQIYVVLGGAGTSEVGDKRFEWSFGDVFVAPLATRIAHHVREDALLVALSDEALMKFCGFDQLQAA